MSSQSIQINREESLEGKPVSEIALKLGLPFEFLSEVIHETPELQTYGDLVTHLTKEYRRELIKIKNTG